MKESSGKRVHCSENTRNLLLCLGNFRDLEPLLVSVRPFRNYYCKALFKRNLIFPPISRPLKNCLLEMPPLFVTSRVEAHVIEWAQ